MPRKNAPLPNYLRTYRIKAGLFQGDVGALIGATESKMRPHESGVRLPSLMTALAYEAIFDVPLRKMFAGIDEAVRFAVKRQAKHLLKKVEVGEKCSPQRLAMIRRIAGESPDAATEHE